ncbi:MAG: lasso peptide biosynthesis B2 protein [Egibacteraceae bacterium]
MPRVDPEAVFVARQLTVPLRGGCRAVFGTQPCLFESVVLAAGLRQLRFEATVVVGSERKRRSQSRTPFHAWVEIGGEPVDGLGNLSSYQVRHTFPRG